MTGTQGPLGLEAGNAGRRHLVPRFVAFGIAVVLAVTALGLRLFQLQLAEGSTFAAFQEVSLTTQRPIPVPRGLVYDRRNRLLVENVPTFVLRVMPAEMPFEQRLEVVERIAELTGVRARKIIERIDRHTGSQFELVRITDIDTQTARTITEDPSLFPGVHVDLEARRNYTQGRLMAHVLGWTGRINAAEYANRKERGYYPEDLIGKAGLEATWEDVLRGTYGLEQVDLDREGHETKSPVILREAEPGSSLVLTIDTKVQKQAQKALKWAMDRIGVKRGAFLAMNPQNGEVLAMVSLPSYDNNKFAQGISMVDYNRLLRDPSKPMLNVAINEQYPPGSTYKLVTGTGALADGKITPTSRLLSQPFLKIGDWKYYEWNGEGWGPLNIYDGFGHSSDTFFYQLAARLTIDRLAYWAHQFGFGKPTGIDLPGEASGIVPTNEWKRRTKNEIFFTGELYQAGIGQGYNMSTPIQMLNAYAALANGGTLYKPQLVKRVVAADGEVVERVEPEVIRRLDVDRSVLRTMRAAARRVVTIRHTDNLVDLPIVVAGKSGTAEFGIRDKQGRLPFSNWFAAFVPKEARRTVSDPTGINAVKREDADLVVLAYLDDTRTVGNAATEVVKYFLQLHYGLKVDLRNFDYLVRDNDYSFNS
jgi:penicillin-binding protein 2